MIHKEKNIPLIQQNKGDIKLHRSCMNENNMK